MEDNLRLADRLFDLLEIFAKTQEPLALTDLVKMTSISKTTVYRLLQKLCERGYVERVEGVRYILGTKLVELSSYHIGNLELLTVARSYLVDLYADLKLTVHLGKLQEDKVIYMGLIDSSRQTLNFNSGLAVPALTSSIGKCLLSCMSGEEQEQFLMGSKMEQYTAKTIIDREAFKAHLKTVRRQGWAIDDGEYLPDRRCVGAPIFDYLGTAIACVSVSGSTAEMTDDKLATIIREVKETAKQISRHMGYIAD